MVLMSTEMLTRDINYDRSGTLGQRVQGHMRRECNPVGDEVGTGISGNQNPGFGAGQSSVLDYPVCSRNTVSLDWLKTQLSDAIQLWSGADIEGPIGVVSSQFLLLFLKTPH